MMEEKKKKDLQLLLFHFPPFPLKFFEGRFIQDVTAACVLVGAFRRVTAFCLPVCVCVCVYVCECVCVLEQFLKQ